MKDLKPYPWVSVKDRLPENCVIVLTAHCSVHDANIAHYHKQTGLWKGTEDWLYETPKFWMPIPELIGDEG